MPGPPTDPAGLAAFLTEKKQFDDAKNVVKRVEDENVKKRIESQIELEEKKTELEEAKKELITEDKEVKKQVQPTITANVVGYIIITVVAIIILIGIYYLLFRRVPRPVQRLPQQFAQAPQMVMRGGAKGIKSIKKQLKRLFK